MAASEWRRTGHGSRSAALMAALLALGGCSDEASEFGPLEPRDFSLGGERYRIDLPEKASVSEDPNGAFVWIELTPGRRSSPSIWLETPYDETQPFAFDHQKNWSAGRSLDYRTEVSVDGSGGPEASLDGRLAYDGHRWSVACALQKEGAVSADADWCLPLLGSIEVAPL